MQANIEFEKFKLLYILKKKKKVFDRVGNGCITSSDLRSVLRCLGEEMTEDESKLDV